MLSSRKQVCVIVCNKQTVLDLFLIFNPLPPQSRSHLGQNVIIYHITTEGLKLMHVRRGLEKDDDDDDDYFYKDAVERTQEATIKTKRMYQYLSSPCFIWYLEFDLRRHRCYFALY